MFLCSPGTYPVCSESAPFLIPDFAGQSHSYLSSFSMDSYEKTNFSSSHTSPVLFSDDMIQEKVFFSVLEERKLD